MCRADLNIRNISLPSLSLADPSASTSSALPPDQPRPTEPVPDFGGVPWVGPWGGLGCWETTVWVGGGRLYCRAAYCIN